MVVELRNNVGVVQALERFQYKTPKGKDEGINVRNRAKTLVELIMDKERTKQEREKVPPPPPHTSLGSSTDILLNLPDTDPFPSLSLLPWHRPPSLRAQARQNRNKYRGVSSQELRMGGGFGSGAGGFGGGGGGGGFRSGGNSSRYDDYDSPGGGRCAWRL